LMPSAVADLTRPWAPFIMASDASPDFGFGVCRAPCSPGIVREAADAAHLPQHEICPQMMEGDPAPRDRGLLQHWLPFGIERFTVLRSMKARRCAHSSALEATAAVLAMKHLANRRRWHAHRVFMLVDATAVLFAFRKGRSSAKNLRYQTMQMASVLAAADIRLHFGYVSSERNPADWPSRGLRYGKARASREKTPRLNDNSMFDKRMKKLRASIRRLGRCGHFDDGLSSGCGSYASSSEGSEVAQPSLPDDMMEMKAAIRPDARKDGWRYKSSFVSRFA
jgi:hypothetical protein